MLRNAGNLMQNFTKTKSISMYAAKLIKTQNKWQVKPGEAVTSEGEEKKHRVLMCPENNCKLYLSLENQCSLCLFGVFFLFNFCNMSHRSWSPDSDHWLGYRSYPKHTKACISRLPVQTHSVQFAQRLEEEVVCAQTWLLPLLLQKQKSEFIFLL